MYRLGSDQYTYRTVERRISTASVALGLARMSMPGTQYQLTNLKKFTRYSVVVQAYNVLGQGPMTPEVVATTLEDGKEERLEFFSSLKIFPLDKSNILHGELRNERKRKRKRRRDLTNAISRRRSKIHERNNTRGSRVYRQEFRHEYQPFYIRSSFEINNKFGNQLSGTDLLANKSRRRENGPG